MCDFEVLQTAVARLVPEAAATLNIEAVCTYAGNDGDATYLGLTAALLALARTDNDTDMDGTTEGVDAVTAFLVASGSVIYADAEAVQTALTTSLGRAFILEFLVCETACLHLVAEPTPDPKDVASTSMGEARTALGLDQTATLADITAATRERVGQKETWSAPLIVAAGLPAESVTILASINEAFADEYAMRHAMLLRRLDVTIQSLLWSPVAKANLDRVIRRYRPRRDAMDVYIPVSLYDMRAVTTDFLAADQVNSKRHVQDTDKRLRQVIVGDVPDRGGRTSIDDPAGGAGPEFKKRVAGAGGKGHGGSNKKGDKPKRQGKSNRQGGGNKNKRKPKKAGAGDAPKAS